LVTIDLRVADFDFSSHGVGQLGEVALAIEEDSDRTFLATDGEEFSIKLPDGNIFSDVGAENLTFRFLTFPFLSGPLVFTFVFGGKWVAARLAIVVEPVTLVFQFFNIVVFRITDRLPVLPEVKLVQKRRPVFVLFLLFLFILIFKFVAIFVITDVLTVVFLFVLAEFIIINVRLEFGSTLAWHWNVGPAEEVRPNLVGSVLTIAHVTLELGVGEVKVDDTLELLGFGIVELDTDLMFRVLEGLRMEPDVVQSVPDAIFLNLFPQRVTSGHHVFVTALEDNGQTKSAGHLDFFVLVRLVESLNRLNSLLTEVRQSSGVLVDDSERFNLVHNNGQLLGFLVHALFMATANGEGELSFWKVEVNLTIDWKRDQSLTADNSSSMFVVVGQNNTNSGKLLHDDNWADVGRQADIGWNNRVGVAAGININVHVTLNTHVDWTVNSDDDGQTKRSRELNKTFVSIEKLVVVQSETIAKDKLVELLSQIIVDIAHNEVLDSLLSNVEVPSLSVVKLNIPVKKEVIGFTFFSINLEGFNELTESLVRFSLFGLEQISNIAHVVESRLRTKHTVQDLIDTLQVELSLELVEVVTGESGVQLGYDFSWNDGLVGADPVGLESVEHVENVHFVIIKDHVLRIDEVTIEVLVGQFQSKNSILLQVIQTGHISFSQRLQSGVDKGTDLLRRLIPSGSSNLRQELVGRVAGDHDGQSSSTDLSNFVNVKENRSQNLHNHARMNLSSTSQSMDSLGPENRAISDLSGDDAQKIVDSFGSLGVTESVDEDSLAPVVVNLTEFLADFLNKTLLNFSWAVEVLRDERRGFAGVTGTVAGDRDERTESKPSSSVNLGVLLGSRALGKVLELFDELEVRSQDSGWDLLEEQSSFLTANFFGFNSLLDDEKSWGRAGHDQNILADALGKTVFVMLAFLVNLFQLLEVEHTDQFLSLKSLGEDFGFLFLFNIAHFLCNLMNKSNDFLDLNFLLVTFLLTGPMSIERSDGSLVQIKLAGNVQIFSLEVFAGDKTVLERLQSLVVATVNVHHLLLNWLLVAEDQSAAGVGQVVVSIGGVRSIQELFLSFNLFNLKGVTVTTEVVLENSNVRVDILFGGLAVGALFILKGLQRVLLELVALVVVAVLGDVEDLLVGSSFPRLRGDGVGGQAHANVVFFHDVVVNEDVIVVLLGNNVHLFSLAVSQRFIQLQFDHGHDTLLDVQSPFGAVTRHFEAMNLAVFKLNTNRMAHGRSHLAQVNSLLNGLRSFSLEINQDLFSRTSWHRAVQFDGFHTFDHHKDSLGVQALESDVTTEEDTGELVLQVRDTGHGFTVVLVLVLMAFLEANRGDSGSNE